MQIFFLSFTVCLGITLLRNTMFVSSPWLIWDDVYLFNDFYNGNGSLFHIYPDNLSMAPNIIFTFAFRIFDTQYLPIGLEALTLAFFSFISAFFSLPLFRRVMQDDRKRLLLCAWLAVMPVSDGSLIISPDYQNWSCMVAVLLFTALLIVVAIFRTKPVSPTWLIFLVPCALSTPVSLCAAPFSLIGAVLALRHRDLLTATTSAGLAAACVICAVLAMHTLPTQSMSGGLSLPALFGAIWKSILFFIDRGFVEAFLGSPNRQAILSAFAPAAPGLAPAVLYISAAVLLVGGLSLAKKYSDPVSLCFAATLITIAIVYSFLVIASASNLRGMGSSGSDMLTTTGRYWYVQKVALLVAFGSTVLNSVVFQSHLNRGAAYVSLTAFLLTYTLNANTGSRYGLALREDPRAAVRERRSSMQQAFLRAVRTGERQHLSVCWEEPGDDSMPRLKLFLPKGSKRDPHDVSPCSNPLVASDPLSAAGPNPH